MPGLKKFQGLLTDLFQFDSADLDFGIYRIMNHKRDVARRFIRESLPDKVEGALSEGPLAAQVRARARLAEAERDARETIGDEAFNADGSLNYQALTEDVRKLPVVAGAIDRYLEAKREADNAIGSSRAGAAERIYNHLYAFFSRYYQEGDFISKRRYSRNNRYAIPYNGEEVYLHWANSDQYYVKSEERFYNYDWKAPNGVDVRFRLDNADVERNNVKGDKRFFLPLADKTEWDAGARAVSIPFEYRPLDASERADYNRRNTQDDINERALVDIPRALAHQADAAAALTAERRRNGGGEAVSHLQHHLRRYVARNNADFFIHKDLRGFLNRELDFYLKNEVLNLDDLAVAGLDFGEAEFQIMRLVKSVGGAIIDFLAQIEDFQKMLWEKRKFVTSTNYCIALNRIDPDFYPEIAANVAQWQEWRDLGFSTPSSQDQRFLSDNPTLLLDTRHFDQRFTDELLASFDDLDGLTDGVLVHGDNWQALRLMQEKRAAEVECVYIDPPYNTGQDGFLYKDHYQHSTWMAMMDSLMPALLDLMAGSGSFVSHVDEHEFSRLDSLISMRFGTQRNIGPIIWDKRNPKGDATAIASQHEYLCWAVKDYDALKMGKRGLIRKKENAQAIIRKAAELVQSHHGATDKAQGAFKAWMRKQNFAGGEKAYSNLDDNGEVYRSVSMSWPNSQQAPEEYFQPLIHPATAKPCPVPARGWRNTPKTMKTLLAKGLILFGPDETTQPGRKYLLRDNMEENVPSIYYFGGSDQTAQNNMGYSFPNPKPVRLAEYVVSIAAPHSDAVILDCFAGSGTTGHAVINLNREDGGRRKFILVEMGEYFDAVLLPRVKKAIFAPEWREGKPRRMATPEEAERSPRVIKYITLESYEDALDSIQFDAEASQLPLEEFDEDYLLKYMLFWETKNSPVLLNAAELTRPFSYKLRAHINGQKRARAVDIPETFNWLLGLNVSARRVHYDDCRRYLAYLGETRERPGKRTAVIWRDTEGWEQADFARDREFVKENGLDAGADAVYVNGGSCIPDAKAIEPLFKTRMFSAATG